VSVSTFADSIVPRVPPPPPWEGKLKPCPFCGSVVTVGRTYPTLGGTWYRAFCTAGNQCPITPATAHCLTPESAVEVWEKATEKHARALLDAQNTIKWLREQVAHLQEYMVRNGLDPEPPS